uniref:Uncharacterized protein n=1 Tax=Dechloromonas aromatica (strain RCB) TaxID=159087 RepID=Q47GN5_DECAR
MAGCRRKFGSKSCALFIKRQMSVSRPWSGGHNCINYCFLAPVEKGSLKTQNFSQKRAMCAYLIAHTGRPAEKSKLEVEFLKWKTALCKSLITAIESLRPDMNSVKKGSQLKSLLLDWFRKISH